MRPAFKLILWSAFAIALAPAARAQIQPPPVGQPPNFSGAVGSYTIRHSAAPTEVVVEDPLLLTVAITGSGPKGQEPKRELLKLFPDGMEQGFFIEAVPEKDRHLPEEKTWEFVYRLRPKQVGVKEVPALQFNHWNPALKRYQPARTPDAIPLIVKPRAVAVIEKAEKPLVIPPGFERLYAGPDDLRPWSPPIWTTPQGMALAFGMPVIACGLWYWRWRRNHPDVESAARRRQSEAARKALHSLRTLVGPSDGERLSRILTTYVQERLDVPAQELTAADLEEALRRRRVSPKVIQQGRLVIGDIDAARFGQPAQRKTASSLELAGFIGEVEEALC